MGTHRRRRSPVVLEFVPLRRRRPRRRFFIHERRDAKHVTDSLSVRFTMALWFSKSQKIFRKI